MAPKDKPYRVYRGGRTKGPVPRGHPRDAPEKRDRPPDGADPYARPQPRRRRRRRRWLRIGLLLILSTLLLAIVWGVLGYLAFRSGVSEANDRLDSRAYGALAPQNGLIMRNPSTILVLGTDEGPTRQGPFRSDAMMIIRTDPGDNRIALLSIPRDLRVEIPGQGTEKINAAYAFGGPTLAIRAVQALTGQPINHVIVMDFEKFREVIDALGGVTIDVPRRILSNKFECPFATQARCDRWPGWRFAPGPQEMSGDRALVYSRIRQNQLSPSESDITRGERQQAVLQATADEITGFGTYLRGPFIGDDLVRPLATDLTANELAQLGWVKYRTPASGILRCRLGGTIADVDGESVILGSEENAAVIEMILGRSAPQPPLPGSGPFGPGCLVGRGR